MNERDGDGKLVMVVDDFEDTRGVLRQMLESEGYSVVEAANGQEAIERARGRRPDVILMDLNMPILDGFTATLSICEYEPTRDVPVVAVTAFDTAEFRSAARAVGCTEYLVKPVDFDRLAGLLRQLTAPARGSELARGDAAR